MNDQDFIRIIDQAFTPFLKELGFVTQPKAISGRAYMVEFVGDLWTLSVSFEPGDNYFSVILLNNKMRGLAAMDDPQKSPRLSALNTRYMGKVAPAEREANEAFFASIVVTDSFEKQLLKVAKDLRLVLPKHLAA
jgi:hypothetical protein